MSGVLFNSLFFQFGEEKKSSMPRNWGSSLSENETRTYRPAASRKSALFKADCATLKNWFSTIIKGLQVKQRGECHASMMEK